VFSGVSILTLVAFDGNGGMPDVVGRFEGVRARYGESRRRHLQRRYPGSRALNEVLEDWRRELRRANRG